MRNLTLGAMASGSVGAIAYLIKSTKQNKEKRSGHGFDGYDTDGYDVDGYTDEEVIYGTHSTNTTPDVGYYPDVPIKDKANSNESDDVSSTNADCDESNDDPLIICELDDMVFSNLSVEIPPSRYNRIGDYEVYDDYEKIKDFFE